jgi:hypothetical protein
VRICAAFPTSAFHDGPSGRGPGRPTADLGQDVIGYADDIAKTAGLASGAIPFHERWSPGFLRWERAVEDTLRPSRIGVRPTQPGIALTDCLMEFGASALAPA